MSTGDPQFTRVSSGCPSRGRGIRTSANTISIAREELEELSFCPLSDTCISTELNNTHGAHNYQKRAAHFASATVNSGIFVEYATKTAQIMKNTTSLARWDAECCALRSSTRTGHVRSISRSQTRYRPLPEVTPGFPADCPGLRVGPRRP